MGAVHVAIYSTDTEVTWRLFKTLDARRAQIERRLTAWEYRGSLLNDAEWSDPERIAAALEAALAFVRRSC